MKTEIVLFSVGRREYDEDGDLFPICRYDKESNKIKYVEDKKIIFSLTEQSQVRKAIKDIAKELRRDFKISLESELLPLNPENPAKIPTIKYYIDEVDSFLNYLGSVYGINFEYSIYLEYKEITRNQLITAKTKLYNDRAIKKSIDFVENWFNDKDKIYLQKREFYKDAESEKQPLTENKIQEDTKVNPHPRIFKNSRSYKIFEHLHNNLVRKIYQLADYSFIFRQMKKDGLIYDGIGEREFRDFLLKEYQIELEKLKTEGYCETDDKNNIYSITLHQIK